MGGWVGREVTLRLDFFEVNLHSVEYVNMGWGFNSLYSYKQLCSYLFQENHRPSKTFGITCYVKLHDNKV